jgi:hypothetical protein
MANEKFACQITNKIREPAKKGGGDKLSPTLSNRQA